MKIDLPLEVWVDSFESLSRKQLAALLPHIGDEHEETKNRPIADRQFVKNVQFYLHKCGDVTLGKFSIQSSWKGPVFINKAGQKLLLAEMPPMPSNIKNFTWIILNYYDQSVLDFLQEFRRNSLLTNVNLLLCGENRRKFDALSKMMAQLLPSIGSIESLTPYNCSSVHNASLFQEEHAAMMASARILLYCDFGFGYDDWYRHWLHIPREDGKPRVLVAYLGGIDSILPFIEHIKKDFLDANQAVSFFACILGRLEDGIVQSVSLANDKTQEKLMIKGIDPNPDLGHFVTLSRYPMGATEEWIEENAQIIRDRNPFQGRIIQVDIKSGYFTSCSLI